MLLSAAAGPVIVPTPPPPPRRRGIPLLASVVPILGAVVLWLVTGSPFALWFALLAPVVAAAGLLDGRRIARRDRRSAIADALRGRDDARRAVGERHDVQRAALESAHPDVAGFLTARDEIWRSGRSPVVTAGRGVSPSDVVVMGDDEIAAEARGLADSPQPVPLAGGVCVVGPRVLGLAVARSLVLQACLALPPGSVSVVGGPPTERPWLDALPHTRSGSSAVRVGFLAPGEKPPVGCDGVIAVVAPGSPLPPWCEARLSLESGEHGSLDAGGRVRDVRIEAISRAQALAIARTLAERAEQLSPALEASSGPRLHDLLGGRRLERGSLAVPVGADDAGPVTIDLVGDGPHALVVGVTGTGKSELLVSWVTALASAGSTREVTFLLADFKGGTAFDGLRALPHVTGVITDLDGDGVPRAIESLRAELRRREGVLARAGARDIDGCGGALARLVIIVDEFAALLADHPELQRVFVDIAARGRALGMHLVLGTQRAGGVIREALLTNCPLRVCLRVGDTVESRLLLGSDEAAQLPGGAAGRGRALVRRAGDIAPQPLRIALTTADDVAAVVTGAASDPVPPPVWLPALPERVALADLVALDVEGGDALRLALVDEPQLQRRSVLALRPASDRGVAIVGGPGAGKSTALEALARQTDGPVLRIGPDPELAWDAVRSLEAGIARRALILVDDLDALGAQMPPEYEAALFSALDRVLRAAHSAEAIVAVALRRPGGVPGRVADLLPLRVILRMPSRMDHLAAGGDAAAFAAESPPGRGSAGGLRVQVAVADVPSETPATSSPPEWRPRQAISAIVAPAPGRRCGVLAERWPDAEVRELAGLPPGTQVAMLTGDRPVVLVGDPEQWQRHWALLSELRGQGELVLTTECAAHVRILTGSTELPPFARYGSGRAWASDRGGALKRVLLA